MPKSNFIQQHAKYKLYVCFRVGFPLSSFGTGLEHDIKSYWCVLAYISRNRYHKTYEIKTFSIIRQEFRRKFIHLYTHQKHTHSRSHCRQMGFSITCELKYNNTHLPCKDSFFKLDRVHSLNSCSWLLLLFLKA